jgi:hypothetical protein
VRSPAIESRARAWVGARLDMKTAVKVDCGAIAAAAAAWG